MRKVRTIVYGIGAMGSGMVRLMLDKDWIEIVGGICRAYPDPKYAAKMKTGKDLGELAGLGRRLNLVISEDASGVLKKVKPDVVPHATGPVLKDVLSTIGNDHQGWSQRHLNL